MMTNQPPADPRRHRPNDRSTTRHKHRTARLAAHYPWFAIPLVATLTLFACSHEPDAIVSANDQRARAPIASETGGNGERILPFPASPASDDRTGMADTGIDDGLDAWSFGDGAPGDARPDDAGNARADATQRDTSDAVGDRGGTLDGGESVADAGSGMVPICPADVTTAVVECVLSSASDGPFAGDWTRAMNACTSASTLFALLDQACTPGRTETICRHPDHERPDEWVLHCRSEVENAVRDDLCLLDNTWSSSTLSGRLLEVSIETWLQPSAVPASIRSRAAALDARLQLDDWAASWSRAELNAISRAHHIDLTRVAMLESILVYDHRGPRGAVYPVGSLDAVAGLDGDRVVSCTLGEGNNMRPCHTDVDCRSGHVCRGGGDVVGRCIRADQLTDGPRALRPCAGHSDCGPPATLCATGAHVCIPASSRQIVTRWGGFSVDESGDVATASEALVHGGAGRVAGAALRLHLRAPLSFDATVELTAPDGTVFVVPWAADWSRWVPLPHVSGVPDNGVWQLTMRDQPTADGNAFDGWSLRVDSL